MITLGLGIVLAVAIRSVASFAPASFSPSRLSLYAPWPRQASSPRLETTSLSVYEHGSDGIDAQLFFDAWEWTANLGAPAALVAGAVLATLLEGREALSSKKSDQRWVQNLKKACRLLLLTSFGLEVLSIFVTTVTGTMLLSIGDVPDIIKGNPYNSPLGFMVHNFEFEYLTARLSFLQGLFNWLMSVALEILIPRKGEGEGSRRMNRFISSSLMTIILIMLAFLNSHTVYYPNYAAMWRRYVVVVFRKFLWPPRQLTVLIVPSITLNLVYAYKAFMADGDDDDSTSS